MKISLNREYFVRHAGVAAVFGALALWFLYDAVFVYPNLAADAGHHTTVAFQYSAAALLAAGAAIVAVRLWMASRETLEWNDSAMRGSLTNGKEIPFGDVAIVDDKLWDVKSILRLVTRNGRFIDVDGWHHNGVDALRERIKAEGAAAQ